MARRARPTRFRDKWRIRWIDHTGKRCSGVFASYEEAEKQLTRRNAEADAILEGRALPPPTARQVDEVLDYWLGHRAPNKRSAKDDRSMIEGHLRPFFGLMPLNKLSVQDFDAYRQNKSSLSTKTVRNHLTLLGTMLRLAEEMGWMLRVPPLKHPRRKAEEEQEQPWLESAEDIQRFLQAAWGEGKKGDSFSFTPFYLYGAALFTGLRQGELAGLRWEDVDLRLRSIHVKRSYDGATKTISSQRHVPIVDQLLPLLERWKSVSEPSSQRDHVFRNRRGNMLDRSNRLFQEKLHKVLDAAGFEPPETGRRRHFIHFHSLSFTTPHVCFSLDAQ